MRNAVRESQVSVRLFWNGIDVTTIPAHLTLLRSGNYPVSGELWSHDCGNHMRRDSIAGVAALGGSLRELNRRHHLACSLSTRRRVCSARPRSSLSAAPSTSTRDRCACYLLRRSDGGLLLTVEHRSARTRSHAGSARPQPTTARPAPQSGLGSWDGIRPPTALRWNVDANSE